MKERLCRLPDAHGRHRWVIGGEFLDCEGRTTCAGCSAPVDRPHLLACPRGLLNMCASTTQRMSPCREEGVVEIGTRWYCAKHAAESAAILEGER